MARPFFGGPSELGLAFQGKGDRSGGRGEAGDGAAFDRRAERARRQDRECKELAENSISTLIKHIWYTLDTSQRAQSRGRRTVVASVLAARSTMSFEKLEVWFV